MADVQERVAQVEGRVKEQARMVTDIAGSVRHLQAHMEQRFEGMDMRLTALGRKLEWKTDSLEQKLDNHLRWMVGLYVATLIAIAASLIAR